MSETNDTSISLKLDDQLCFAFYACSRGIMKLYRPLLQELGLTYTQYITLLALWEQDAVTVKELGSRLFLDSGTLTPLLKKLEAMGLLSRTRDPKDERNVIITLTGKGQELRHQAKEIPCKIYQDTKINQEDVQAQLAHIRGFLHKLESEDTL
ncbi:MarR family winged helix-turn-helix transcriptional regulator [Paenibacillus brevis]|uniref:MarR family transcriptional regulator n=1 Tax=Paenibacillus brevis TaxID=2841508 RepID=A0ABS6FUG1_9BACL|nr:MarR family transcriptional regulator [Paenibacillus brevis]MBU5673668.1 MarR family transcriptional regulator [Paenibacillus brevis]